MEHTADRNRSRQFRDYVIPSIGAMLVTSLYVVVDGIFVGRGIGVDALAAINLAGPYIMAIIAIAMMITVGGATMTAISLGRSDTVGANRYFTVSLRTLLIFSAVITVISVAFPRPIARLLGASDLLLEDTACYLRYFILFGVLFCSAMALAAFVRNDGAPKLSFWGMMAGGFSNIFLDWLFIFPLHMGIRGPAIASGLGQTLSCLILLSHFRHHHGQLRLRRVPAVPGTVREICRRGTPELMNQLFQPITVLCYNLVAIRVYGEIGVSAFSVVYYILTITVSVFIGLSQGIQPLIGRSFGLGSLEDERYYYRKGIGVNVVLALIIYALMFAAGRPIIALFNPDPRLVEIACSCIRIYGISFLFTAVNIVVITDLTATKHTAEALLVSAVRCLILIPVLVFLLPLLFGHGAVWTGITAAEAVTLLVVWLLRKTKKSV